MSLPYFSTDEEEAPVYDLISWDMPGRVKRKKLGKTPRRKLSRNGLVGPVGVEPTK